jgi:RPA family protein
MQTGVAERLFAHEFNTATAGETDEEILTPLGARCRRIFVVGALTEVQGEKGGPVQARIADPTGVFLIRVSSRDEALAEQLTACMVPSFVALVGSCRCGGRGRGPQPYLIPETVVAVDREARDTWIARTAERTLTRIEQLQTALEGRAAGAGEREVILRHPIDRTRIHAMAEMVLTALDALQRGQRKGSHPLADPKETILVLLGTPREPPVFSVEEILALGRERGFSEKDIRTALEILLEDGECYMPRNGLIKLA